MPAHADEMFWNGSQSDSWFNGLNWTPVGPPGPNDDVVIDTIAPNLTSVNGAATGAVLDLTVGRTGTATLQIFNGGQVDNQRGVIGESSGSLGAVTVTQAGSVWNNAQDLQVGLGGSGTLNVLNGVQVNSNGASGVGTLAGSDGTVLITGAGSAWDNTGSIAVGEAGTGTLVVANGGTLNNSTSGFIGRAAGSEGAVTVTGVGSGWSNGANLFVGSGGTGMLTIAGGAHVDNIQGHVGLLDGAEGTVTVTGAGSLWSNASSLRVAQTGTGTVLVEDGGRVDSAGGFISLQAGAEGAATVTGPGSLWNSTAELVVGYAGTGTLTIADGGTVASTDGVLGDSGGSSGTVTVTGAGSAWNHAGRLLVGNAGSGALTIADGGQVTNAGIGNGLIGVEAGAEGTVLVTGAGSAWDTGGGALYAGLAGNGTLTIADGATVSSSFAGIGDAAGSTGIATVSGGSLWTIGANLAVGSGGDGTLLVDDGSVVTGSSFGFIGGESGDGTVAVDNGSALNLAGGLRVRGNGTLHVSGNSTVDNTNALVGNSAVSEAAVTVSGPGSHWANSEHLVVGDQGLGTLTVADGGMVSSAFGVIGDFADAVGMASVDGAGSLWASVGVLTVGNEGSGALSITDGGAVQAAFGFIGRHEGAVGEVTVDGAGTQWDLGNGMAIGSAGAGRMVVSGGGTVSNAGGFITIGGFTVGAGEVLVSGAGSALNAADDLLVGSAGSGVLTIADGGAVANAAGIVGAGGTAEGAVAVNGTGSAWNNADTIVVGDAGAGTLLVEDGGTTTGGADAVIARAPNSAGTVRVAGTDSAWNIAQNLVVAENGVGALGIAAGGLVSNAIGYVGFEADADGTVAVSGADSHWQNGGSLFVGFRGTGVLDILDGASVDNVGGAIGTVAGSQGTVVLAGEGSQWTTSAQFAVGGGGIGKVTVAEGGNMLSEVAVIGASAGGTGTVTVTGTDSTWHSTSSLIVGSSGTASLAIADGATVSSDSFAWIGSAAGSGSVTVDGAGSRLALDGSATVGRQGTGRLVVANGGGVDTGQIAIASQPGSEGTLDIGAGAAQDAAAPGRLDVNVVSFGDGDGTLNFNHTDDGYDFAPRLGGAGTVNVLAGTTVLGADSGGFGGETFVHAGTLQIDGALGGTLAVLADGTLAGTGTVGTTTVAGTLAPGASIGTLTVDGDVTFAPGSVFEAELGSAGDSDLLAATGTATLNGGLVAALPLNAVAIDSPYTLLTANGGVIGTFDALALDVDSAFLTPTLDYAPDAVSLTLLQSASFASVGQTPNQAATGAGADSLGNGHPVWDAVAVLDEAEARVAFDALSGEIHASTLGALADESRYIRDATNGRLQGAAAGQADARGVWAKALGARGRTDGDGNTARLERSVGGLLVGGDGEFGDGWRLGAAAGYHRSSYDVDARRASARVHSTHLAGYAGKQWGPSALRLGAAYSWHRVDVDRQVGFAGYAEDLRADYDAGTLQLFGEYGYGFDRGDIAWEPFVSLAWAQVDGDGVEETGGMAALTAADSKHDVAYTTLGLRLTRRFDAGRATSAKLHGMLGWQHAFGDTTPQGRFAFAGGDAFAIAGVPLAGNALVVDLGLDFALGDNARIGVSYAGRFASDVRENAARAVFAMDF
ncbi:autotransporter domain-containing protein [Luteimonas suaedae]|uniref:autotransporter domain-containing protein n=1 Tax=Luteimonas suaedae TaxID=2605430 RepID=UPI001658C9ED|nr:autotransporter domain-containing protein [Luteimonas suaedae]